MTDQLVADLTDSCRYTNLGLSQLMPQRRSLNAASFHCHTLLELGDESGKDYFLTW